MDVAITTALANEARRNELRCRVNQIQGEVTTGANLATIISSTVGDAQRRLDAAKASLAALESGAGPGLTDDFGYKADHLSAFIDSAVAAGLITDLDAAHRLAGI
jgi:hypothetical protein